MRSLARHEELAEAIGTSLASGTIEWGANLQVCEILEADPSLAPAAMRGIRAALKKRESVPVLLGLSLLEMIVKNCGIACCRAIDGRMARTLLEIIKHRESWQYGLGRNLHKLGGNWLPNGAGVDEAERGHWVRARQKVLEILQLSVDAFLLHEGELQPLFSVYKQLRKEGYEFPGRSAAGGSAGGSGAGAGNLALVRGSQESPAYLAGLAGGASALTPPEPTPTPEPPPTPSGPGAIGGEAAGGVGLSSGEVSELRAALEQLRGGASSSSDGGPAARGELLGQLHAARPRILRFIEEHAEGGAEELDEVILHGMISLLEELDKALAAEAPAAEQSGCGPPLPAGDEPPPRQGPLCEAELEETRLLLQQLGFAGGPPCDVPSPVVLRKARAVHSRLAAFVTQQMELPAEELDEDFLDRVVTVLEELEEALEQCEADAEHSEGSDELAPARGPAEALPPKPDTRPPSVQEQERYDLVLARFLQDQELQASRHQEEADARLAHLLSLGFEPPAAQAPSALAAAQPWPSLALRAPALPSRSAPPARVIQASGQAPELLIGDDGPATSIEGGSSGSRQRHQRAARPAQEDTANAVGPEEPLAEGLLGSSGSAGASRSKAWARWAPRVSSSSGRLRSLGDGGADTARDYGELAGHADAALLVGGDAGAPPRGYAPSRGLLPWKRKSRPSEQRESLLSRVRVDEEWELVRPPAERPYWHNSTTGLSQWEPPSVVMGGGGGR